MDAMFRSVEFAKVNIIILLYGSNNYVLIIIIQ